MRNYNSTSRCLPGYNSCGVENGRRSQSEVKAPVSGKMSCKPGYNNCAIGGEPRPRTVHAKASDGNGNRCKPGFNSCHI